MSLWIGLCHIKPGESRTDLADSVGGFGWVLSYSDSREEFFGDAKYFLAMFEDLHLIDVEDDQALTPADIRDGISEEWSELLRAISEEDSRKCVWHTFQMYTSDNVEDSD